MVVGDLVVLFSTLFFVKPRVALQRQESPWELVPSAIRRGDYHYTILSSPPPLLPFCHSITKLPQHSLFVFFSTHPLLSPHIEKKRNGKYIIHVKGILTPGPFFSLFSYFPVCLVEKTNP